MNLTLRQLRVFAAVARHRSFTRAAEELHLTQPAVSMQIKQLEVELGLPLFEQAGRKIHLTDAGWEVFHYSRLIAQTLDELDMVLGGLKGLDRGRLRITMATSAHYFAPTLLGIFCQRYPGVSVSLDVTNRQSVLGQLMENDVDMAIMGRPPAGGDLEGAAIMDNPLVVIAPPDHRLAGAVPVPLERLAEETFLVRERGSGTRAAMEQFFRDHELAVSFGMEVSSDSAIKQSVQAGLGLGLMSRDAVEMEVSLGRLIVLDVEHFPILRHWYVVHRKGKRLSPIARAFKEFLLDEATRLLTART